MREYDCNSVFVAGMVEEPCCFRYAAYPLWACLACFQVPVSLIVCDSPEDENPCRHATCTRARPAAGSARGQLSHTRPCLLQSVDFGCGVTWPHSCALGARFPFPWTRLGNCGTPPCKGQHLCPMWPRHLQSPGPS
jgi:hypothetical protein